MERPNGAPGEVFPRGRGDLSGFVAGEFAAGAEGFGEAVDGVELGADHFLSAVAKAEQVAARVWRSPCTHQAILIGGHWTRWLRKKSRADAFIHCTRCPHGNGEWKCCPGAFLLFKGTTWR
jgi:hypothetical protein